MTALRFLALPLLAVPASAQAVFAIVGITVAVNLIAVVAS